MTTTTGIASVTTGVQTSSVQPAQSAAAAASDAAANAASSKPLTAASSSTISPRIVVDPSAGVIIQFLNSNGQLQNQIPSSTVVAYLRAGLTPDGLQKPQTNSA